MKQIKTAWEMLKAFFCAEDDLFLEDVYKDAEQQRYSVWMSQELAKGAENVTVLTPAVRRRYKGLRSVRKYKLDNKGSKK